MIVARGVVEVELGVEVEVEVGVKLEVDGTEDLPLFKLVKMVNAEGPLR